MPRRPVRTSIRPVTRPTRRTNRRATGRPRRTDSSRGTGDHPPRRRPPRPATAVPLITFEAAVVVVVVGGAWVDEVVGGSEVAPPVTGTDDAPEGMDPDGVVADGVDADRGRGCRRRSGDRAGLSAARTPHREHGEGRARDDPPSPRYLTLRDRHAVQCPRRMRDLRVAARMTTSTRPSRWLPSSR